jgi:hypothetical protein
MAQNIEMKKMTGAQVSMQQSAMDARTGMIDMDKIFSGVGAIDRETRKHLAAMVAELLVRAHPSRPCKLSTALCLPLSGRNPSRKQHTQGQGHSTAYARDLQSMA